MRKAEIIERYGVEEYERRLEQARQYRAEHKKEIAEQARQYHAENREVRLAKMKQYNKQYNAENRESINARQRQYCSTRIGRANNLAGGYRSMDKKKGFLNIDNQVDSNFILNNIFTKSCIYCGESDWKKLGCDRIDNSKPHTIDNVVCSCWDCNHERNAMNFDEFMAMKKAAA